MRFGPGRVPAALPATAFVAVVVLCSGCKSAEDYSASTVSTSASPSSTPTPSASAQPAPTAPAVASSGVWKGSYKSVAGTVTIPASLKAGTWTNAETTVALGEGTLALTVDPATNRVSGAVEGPLGPASVAGFFADGGVTATIRRSDPADQGFTGTLEATASAAGLQGTMNGALGQASAVRTATFTLSNAGGAVPSVAH